MFACVYAPLTRFWFCLFVISDWTESENYKSGEPVRVSDWRAGDYTGKKHVNVKHQLTVFLFVLLK